MGFWIPNISAKEIPGTRQFHMEMTNQNTASVELVIPQTQLAAAYFYGLADGGAEHPQNHLLHISSIDVSYDFPKEYAGNTQEFYQDECVKITLNYKEWQTPNQGYESTIENTGQVFSLPLRGLYWQQPNNSNAANFSDPVWGNVQMYLRRGNLRIVRNYTGRRRSPLYIMDYHNTINAQPLTILEWGISVSAEAALFTCGNFSRQHTRDFASSDPGAWIDLYSYSYSLELIQGTWNSLHHPHYGGLFRTFDTNGDPVSFYPRENWNLSALLE
jgi:hypothetical protein